MAYNHTYTKRWASINGWRWLLEVRTATTDLGSVTYTEYPLPADAVDVQKFNRKHEHWPIGIHDAAWMELRIDMNVLRGDPELEYLHDSIVESCRFDANNTIRYNTFVLYSDRGNASLMESEYAVESVTAQKPTVEEESDLDSAFAFVTIRTVCVLKAALEVRKLEDGFATNVIYTSGGPITNIGPSYAEVFVTGLTKVCVADALAGSTKSMHLLSLYDWFRTVANTMTDVGAWAGFNRATNNSLRNTLLSSVQVDPAAQAWTMYKQAATTYTVVGAPLTTADVGIPIRVTDWTKPTFLTGYDYGNSLMSPVNRYNNWWSLVQAIAEHTFTKARVRWARISPSSCYPYVEYERLWDNWGNPVPTLYKRDMKSAKIVRGSKALRSCKVTTAKRHTMKDGQTPGDHTEFNVETVISVAEEEYNVKALLFDNRPEAMGFGNNAGWFYSQFVWFNTLLYLLPSSTKAVMIHTHMQLRDGVETHEMPIGDIVDPATIEPASWGLWARGTQQRDGLPILLATAIRRALSRRNQSYLTATMPLSSDIMPMDTGSVVALDMGARAARYGDLFSQPAVLMESTVDLATCTVDVGLFIRGSLEPV